MTLPLELRSATLADALGMAQVKVDGWRAAYAEILPRAFLDSLSVEGERAQWESGLSQYPATFRVAVQQQRVIGYVVSGAAVESSDPGEGELFALYVSPEHWGGGVGRRLMDQGVADLRSAGFTTAVIWVFEENQRTRAFYERYGFALKPERRTELGVPVVKYALKLR